MADVIETIILIVMYIRFMDALSVIVRNQQKTYKKLKELGVKDGE